MHSFQGQRPPGHAGEGRVQELAVVDQPYEGSLGNHAKPDGNRKRDSIAGSKNC